MALGESMVAESAFDPAVRERFSTSLSRCTAPARARRVEDLISAGKVMAATDQVMPSELFAVAAEAVRAGDQSLLASEIRRLATDQSTEVNYPAVARLFGTPKPTLSNSYRPELLNLRTFPTLMGYSSRIMAETWESNLLYYAALADEIHAQPSQLNLLIPSWTQQTVEKIFATHLEDWPALLRSLRAVGEDVRQKARNRLLRSLEESKTLEELVTTLGRIAAAAGILAAGAAGIGFLAADSARAQEGQRPVFRVKVDMVVLSFTVTDSKGRYVNGLKPKDLKITEDTIPQKLATFAEGNRPPVQVLDDGSVKPLVATAIDEKAPGTVDLRSDGLVGTNVFVLFDTSNYMYRGFVYASDAIADFVRGLDRADSVAVYTYSRNLLRAASLTRTGMKRFSGFARPLRATTRPCTTACS